MSTSQKRVLVVDDDPVIGRSFKGVLSRSGYAVITAHDGEEALNKLKSEKYDVVFTDIKMPGMSGIEVAQRIKAGQPWLPVVIITGFGSDANKAQAEAAGVSGFLDKPLSPEMIERSAREAIEEGEAQAAEAAHEAAAETKGEPESIAVYPKMKMYFLAPFVGLKQTIALPLEGFKMLSKLGERSLVNHGSPRAFASFLQRAAFYALSPLELLYIIALPFAGLGILAWMGWPGIKKAFGLGFEEAAVHDVTEELSLKAIQEGIDRAVRRLGAETKEKVAVAKALDEPATIGDHLKNVGMIFAAPFLGLVYILTFPFVGLGALAWMGTRELVRYGLPARVAIRIKNVALFFAAPVIGLMYIIAFPFVGFGMLAWMGIKALKNRFSK